MSGGLSGHLTNVRSRVEEAGNESGVLEGADTKSILFARRRLEAARTRMMLQGGLLVKSWIGAARVWND
jgi:hypothetical protein